MTAVVYLQRGVTCRTLRTDSVLTSLSRQTDRQTANMGGNDCCCLLAEGRHLQDTENRLRTNISEQKSLNEAAIHADLDQKAKKLDEKVKVRQEVLLLLLPPSLSPPCFLSLPLNEAAIHTDLDQKAKKLDKKVKVC